MKVTQQFIEHDLNQLEYNFLLHFVEINKKRKIDIDHSTTAATATANNKMIANNATDVNMDMQKKLKMDTSKANSKPESISKQRTKVHMLLLLFVQ